MFLAAFGSVFCSIVFQSAASQSLAHFSFPWAFREHYQLWESECRDPKRWPRLNSFEPRQQSHLDRRD